MSEQDAKRKRISDLLDAEIEVANIMDIVKCSRSLDFKVAKMKKDEEGLERKAKKDPTKSMNHLSNDFSVDPMTINHADSEALVDEGYEQEKAYKMQENKKIFTVDHVYNRRGKTTEEVRGVDYGPGSHGVRREEDASLLFQGREKIRKETYYKVLKYTVLTWLKANYPEGNYVWTQNGASSHTSDLCQKFCTANMAHFWPKDMLPSSSPDLNPLDFVVWGELDRKINRTPHPNVDALKAPIRTEWDNMSEEFLINSCKAFRRRVETVIEAVGGHI
ncbi:Uncharacterized protein FKW44_021994, partial [Caligus rogercresseyi]